MWNMFTIDKPSTPYACDDFIRYPLPDYAISKSRAKFKHLMLQIFVFRVPWYIMPTKLVANSQNLILDRINISSALLLTEILDWTQLFAPLNCQHSPVFIFGYADHNGPHTWKLSFPESGGCSQSPINIVTRSACVVQPSEPLKWRGYSIQPVSMTMTNDGNSGKLLIL